MPFKKNSPGCNASPSGCGCASCSICSDDFNRGNDTDIDTGSSCGWTESSGSWEIDSNKLRCTSAGVAICDTTQPDADPSMVVQVEFSHSSTTGKVLVIGGLVDANNYYAARYDLGNDVVQIVRVSGGTPTTLATSATTTMNASTTYTAKLCVGPDGLFCSAYLDGVIAVSANTTATGTQSGLEADSSTATFDNFSFSRGYDATNAPDCEHCTPYCSWCSGTVPEQMQIVINGSFSDQTNCNGTPGGEGHCSDYEGTYILDFFGVSTVAQNSVCMWRYAFPSSACGSANELYFGVFGHILQIAAQLTLTGPNSAPYTYTEAEVYYNKVYGGGQFPLDCAAFSATAFDSCFATGNYCACSSSTAEVTSL